MDVLYSFFKPEVENKGLKLEWLYQVPEDVNIIQTDKHKLHSILTNLIKNAIKYSDVGEIEIGCYKEQQFLEFYVKDEGIGIPKNRIEAIFQRFEQVDVLDARAFEGSGLGLAICKAYAEMLGGSIWVDSTLGVGSVFYFNIPILK
nr:ATP-binding protein [Lentimicrobium sp. L6]